MAAKKPRKVRESNKAGWQAEKSAMMRDALLNAAIKAFVDLGYANTTTTLVAEYAEVSRGAMLHHFPSRASFVTEVVKQLIKIRSSELKQLELKLEKCKGEFNDDRVHQALELIFEYLSNESSIAVQEVRVAARTDPGLYSVFHPEEVDLERALRRVIDSLFSDWGDWADPGGAGEVFYMMVNGVAATPLIDRKREVDRAFELIASLIRPFQRGRPEFRG